MNVCMMTLAVVSSAAHQANSDMPVSNTLSSDLHDITDTSTFRKRLKSVLLIVLITDCLFVNGE